MAVGFVAHGLEDVVFFVFDQDDFRPGFFCRLGFLTSADGGDGVGAFGSEDLTEPAADAAARGEHQHPFPALDRVRLFGEGEGRHALQKGGAGVGGGDIGWDQECACRGAGAVFGVGRGAHPDHAVAGGKAGFGGRRVGVLVGP